MRIEGLVIASCLGLGTADLLAINLVLTPQLAGEPVGAPATLALVVPREEPPPPPPSTEVAPAPVAVAVPVAAPVGVAAPVAPPPAPPTPSPEPVAVVAETAPLGSIYFDKSLARLDTKARDATDELARELRQHPSWTVRVTGRTDASGSDEWNRELSARRAHAVAVRLRAAGVDASRIDAEGVAAQDAEGSPESCRRADVVVRGGGK